MGHYVIALHVRNTGANSGNRGMITLIEFDGQLFEATAPGDPHRLLWNSVEPSIGWRGTNFQDVAWPGVDTTHVCTSNPGSKVSLDYLNFAGGCPKW